MKGRKMDIINNNMLIAQFDDIKFIKGNDKYLCDRHDYNTPDESCTCYKKHDYYIDVDRTIKFPKNLKYHSSYDWLMPVVEKISRLQTKEEEIIFNGNESYFDTYYLRTFGMINSETKEFMVRINRFPLHQSTSLIEATYEAVVEFINCYNEKVKK